MRNQKRWKRTIEILGVIGALLGSGVTAGHAESPHTMPVQRAAMRPLAREIANDDPLIDPVSEQGQRARGLYFSAPVWKRLGASGIARRLKSMGLDAAVLDMKDGEGRVSYDTQIPSLQPQKRKFIDDVPGMIAELKSLGIYTIARVVCFSDPFLPRNEPDRAIMDNRPHKQGKIWASWGNRNTWLDPYNPKNHDLIVDIAKEVEALGFDEIQFDYIRWPVDSTTRWAHYPSQVDTPRRQVLIGMLKRIDEAVRIPIGADVFGLAAFRVNEGDPAGLGQALAEWTPYVEVFSPMLYLNGMQAYIPKGTPKRAERLIYGGVKALRTKVGHEPVIRPFLQAFEAGTDYFDPEFITEQIRAAKSAGGDGFLFWHPGSNFSMVQAAMAGPARGMHPFAIDERISARRKAWGLSRDDAELGEQTEEAKEASARPAEAAPSELAPAELAPSELAVEDAEPAKPAALHAGAAAAIGAQRGGKAHATTGAEADAPTGTSAPAPAAPASAAPAPAAPVPAPAKPR